MLKSYIRSVGVCLPEKIMTNDDLAKSLDTNDEWIFSHTGIHERRIAADSEACSDIAYNASISAIKNLRNAEPDSDFSASDIDLVLLATSTPDYRGFPSTACIVQERLSATNAGAMDLSAACTGFIYALETARSFVVAGSARNVLVIGAEILSRILNWQDRSTCVLFGDGAGAVIVSAMEDDAGDGATGNADRGNIEQAKTLVSPAKSELISSILLSKGSGAEHLLCPAGGSRNPYRSGEVLGDDSYMYMNGRQVYIFAIQAIAEVVNTLLARHNVTLDDIDHIIPHQANRRIIEAACKRNEWPIEKFFMNMDRFANTSAASIPIALEEMLAKGILHSGQRLLTVGFGAGLTYGGNYLVW